MTPDAARAIEQDCARLIHLYANLMDAGDWDGVAALYTEDGCMARPTAPDQLIEGRAAILASLSARPPRVSRHICANIVVTPDSDVAARAASNILLFTAAPMEDSGLPALAGPPLVGVYQDRFQRTAEGWRFTERRGRLAFRAA